MRSVGRVGLSALLQGFFSPGIRFLPTTPASRARPACLSSIQREGRGRQRDSTRMSKLKPVIRLRSFFVFVVI